MISNSNLRLFDVNRPGQASDDRRKWSLTDFFAEHLRPRLLEEDRSPKTIQEYFDSLKLWEQATDRVPIEAIDERCGRRFADALRKRVWRGQPISTNTRRKHLVNVQFILDRLMPKGRYNPWGSGLLEDVPALSKPSKVVHEVDESMATREDLVKLRAACAGVFKGRGLALRIAAWRDLYELAFWTGMRLEALAHVESQWLVDDEISKRFEGRWIAIPAEYSKTGRPYRVFCTKAAMPLIDRLDARLGRWFDCVMRSENRFYKERRAIEAAAETPPSASGLHAIRKLVYSELSRTSEAAAKLQLGHAGGVGLTHYTSRMVQAEHCSLRLSID